MQAVILAGGRATRLGALTENVPKSLLPVAGKPFLAWQLEALRGSGFHRALLLVGHLGDQIREFAGDGSRFGIHLTYCEDGPVPLGTGGALRNASRLLTSEFLVTYGDSYLPFDYAAPLRNLRVHQESLGCMAVHENHGQWDKSNTAVKGELVTRYDKHATSADFSFIDYGALALVRDALSPYPEGEAFGLERIQSDLAASGRLIAHRVRTRFYEIGSAEGLKDLESYLAARP